MPLWIYGTGYGHEHEKVYRNRLKSKIVDEFGDEILFLNVDGQTPEVTVSRATLDSTTVIRDKNAVLKQVAEYLHEEIMSYAANYKASWPPTCDSLKEEEKDYPSILNEFFTCVLKSKDPPCSDSIKRLISSYGYHLIHGVTRGKVVTLKHFLLGVGLHNITGLKLPIRVLSHLGHCIDNDLVCDIETAEDEVAQKMYENDLTQLTQISATEAPILTYWWADNFNQTLESYSGHGVINSTHIVEFSEPEETAAMLDISLNIPRNKKGDLWYHQTAKICLRLWWIKRKSQLLFQLQFLKQPR